jgi:hypothetical protein
VRRWHSAHITTANNLVGLGLIYPAHHKIPVKEKERAFPGEMRVRYLDHAEIFHVRTFTWAYDMVNTDHRDFISAALQDVI